MATLAKNRLNMNLPFNEKFYSLGYRRYLDIQILKVNLIDKNCLNLMIIINDKRSIINNKPS